MYKGDFLPEDLYSPWADKKREELRNKYIELLHQTAHLHEQAGFIRKKRLIVLKRSFKQTLF